MTRGEIPGPPCSRLLEGFARERIAGSAFQEALRIPGLELVYSTRGRRRPRAKRAGARRLRDPGGQDPMDVVVSATSRAAESLGLADRIGAISKGMETDIIALDGDPLADPAAVDRAAFVIRAAGLQERARARRRRPVRVPLDRRSGFIPGGATPSPRCTLRFIEDGGRRLPSGSTQERIDLGERVSWRGWNLGPGSTGRVKVAARSRRPSPRGRRDHSSR